MSFSPAGALTVIMQDGTAALEVYSGSKQDACDGTWVPVDPVPGALTINTGDMLTVWSNGRFKTPEHRVRAMTEVQRYSAPYFYNPAYEAVVAPLITWEQQQYPKYRPLVWGEFRRQRFAGDFSNLGKEIQIEDYLI
jgi:isopenicillin N synthase-like dioxygenase